MMHHVHLLPDHPLGQNAAMNLAKIRNSRKLSQRALGEMVGMDAATIQRAEVMHPTAKLATYKKCAEALGVTLPDLFVEDQTPVEAELLRIFRSIPEDRHDEILAIIRLVETQDRKAS